MLLELAVVSVVSVLALPSSNPCQVIANAVSSASQVFYPNSPQYSTDVFHWASSNSLPAMCSVEPGTTDDVGKILRIVGSSRTPFAIKSGGHATNAGFSSTTGVHIAMSRFNKVSFNSAQQTATIGTGLTWDQVYTALEPFGVNVVGGRVSGPGVGGFVLGGGYSWLTNQFGLTVDNIVSYELVLPNGAALNVTQASNPILFFGLKGGFNNFGIVTRVTMKAYPQGQVWGGVLIYPGQVNDAVTAANTKFASQVTDRKAAAIASFSWAGGNLFTSQLLFYDGPSPPQGIFDDFLAIPTVQQDVSSRSFTSLVMSGSASFTAGTRQLFSTVPLVTNSAPVIAAIINQTTFWSSALAPSGLVYLAIAIEPFLPTILTHSTSATAYPPTRGEAFLPLNILISWVPTSSDSVMHNAAQSITRSIRQAAIADGQDIGDAPLYPNYAAAGTPIEDMYGQNTLPLKALKVVVDPGNVMGLAGGWKF